MKGKNNMTDYKITARTIIDAFNKVSSIAGIPLKSIRLVPNGMGYYRVHFYDEPLPYLVEAQQ